ncbi:MAG: beta-hydroxyacyl-ACP dehydratase [Bacteroidales bacterium]|nr:beta-hydroxyacyl-ACP dehydratase [Bacteroidales bacterium]
MNREEIKGYLPHREPMLLVDESFMDEEGIAHGKYLIKEDEFFCRGHFPGNPIVPGVILCEIMAQSCSIALAGEINGRSTFYSGIDNVRFKTPVKPGDLCEVSGKMVAHKSIFYVFEAKLCVNGKLCCSGTLTFALV